MFYDGLLVLNKFSPTWVIDRFFFETLGVSYSSIFHFVDRNSQSQRPPPWADIQRGHFKACRSFVASTPNSSLTPFARCFASL